MRLTVPSGCLMCLANRCFAVAILLLLSPGDLFPLRGDDVLLLRANASSETVCLRRRDDGMLALEHRDASHRLKWSALFDAGDFVGGAVLSDSGSCVVSYLCGASREPSRGDYRVQERGASGDVLWDTRLGDGLREGHLPPIARVARNREQHAIALCGRHSFRVAPDEHLNRGGTYVAGIDPAGKVTWAISPPNEPTLTRVRVAEDVCALPDGTFVIVGVEEPLVLGDANERERGWVKRITSSGELLSERSIERPGNRVWLRRVVPGASSAEYVVAGLLASISDAGPQYGFLASMNADGRVVWEKLLDIPSSNPNKRTEVEDLVILGDDSVLVVGGHWQKAYVRFGALVHGDGSEVDCFSLGQGRIECAAVLPSRGRFRCVRLGSSLRPEELSPIDEIWIDSGVDPEE